MLVQVASAGTTDQRPRVGPITKEPDFMLTQQGLVGRDTARPPCAGWEIGRVYRCAWCHGAAPVPGGLPYYTYRADGEPVAVTPDAHASFSGSDGICRAHRLAILARSRAGRNAA
jgi:hypothetical protein